MRGLSAVGAALLCAAVASGAARDAFPATSATSALTQTAATSSPPASEDGPRGAAARAAVREVLATREFAALDRKPGWFERALKWVRERLASFAGSLRDMPAWGQWAFTVLLAGTLIALLGHVTWGVLVLLGVNAKARGRGRRGATARGESLGVPQASLDAVGERALELLAAGEWLAAMKHVHLAVLVALDAAGLVAFHAAKTNGDYLRELRSGASESAALGRLTLLVDAAAFGAAPATADAAREAFTLAGALAPELAVAAPAVGRPPA